jgi:hypothetical protein
MFSKMKKSAVLFAALVLAFVVPANAVVTATSGIQTVNMSMGVGESLSLAISGGPVVFNYNLAAGTASTSNVLSITETYNLSASSGGFAVSAWVSSPTSALSSGSVNIPSSNLFGKVGAFAPAAFTTNGASTNMTDPNVVLGAALTIFDSANTPTHTSAGTATQTLTLSLSGLPSLAPGSYVGTLNIEAVTDM